MLASSSPWLQVFSPGLVQGLVHPYFWHLKTRVHSWGVHSIDKKFWSFLLNHGVLWDSPFFPVISHLFLEHSTVNEDSQGSLLLLFSRGWRRWGWPPEAKMCGNTSIAEDVGDN